MYASAQLRSDALASLGSTLRQLAAAGSVSPIVVSTYSRWEANSVEMTRATPYGYDHMGDRPKSLRKRAFRSVTTDGLTAALRDALLDHWARPASDPESPQDQAESDPQAALRALQAGVATVARGHTEAMLLAVIRHAQPPTACDLLSLVGTIDLAPENRVPPA